MTFQQKFEELQNAFAVAGDKYSKLDKQMTITKGFGEGENFFEYKKAYAEWQATGRAYFDFLDMIKGKDFDVNDEYTWLN